MTTTSTRLINGFNRMMFNAGQQISIRYFLQTQGAGTLGSVYDEPAAGGLVQSGNYIFTSGIIFPVGTEKGSHDAILIEQGKLNETDYKLYVNGSTIFSVPGTGSVLQCKIGLGSPGTHFYSLIPIGATQWTISEIPVYKKAYIRTLTCGSLIGE